MKYHFGAVAELIKSYRAKTDLSQSDLSRAMGYLNGQFISNVERALCSIPMKKLRVVCDVLRIPDEEMKRALMHDYSIDIDNGLLNGDTDEQVLSIHSSTAGSGQTFGQTLQA